MPNPIILGVSEFRKRLKPISVEMRKEERYKGVLDWFQTHVPVAETELHYRNPYELLIAVILSAQCTDKRVNMITPALFEAFPEPEVMAASTPEVVYEYIKSVSYPNNKAKHLVGMAKMLVEDFGGKVPSEVNDLMKLPGVGRKTANLVLAKGFGIPAICVDVHVHRICNRLGYVHTKNPEETEFALRKKLPQKYWLDINTLLVTHGQNICKPIKPKCDECPINKYCEKLI